MGNGCSKNIRRLNKNTVAPNQVLNPPSPINVSSNAEPIKCRVTQTFTHQPNRIEIAPVDNKSATTSRLQTTSRHNNLATSSIGKTDVRHSCSSSNVDADVFNFSSDIDAQSIIFDRNEPKSTKPSFTHSISVDSSSYKSVKSAEAKRFSLYLNRLFKSNQNLTNTSNATTKHERNRSFPKLYHRLSGSVQSLFTGNLNSNRKRNLSASDTNLNRINPRAALTQQQLIDNDYCPSVLYNRKARKSYSERNLDKTQTFSRWKNQLWLKFSRKKSNPTARKS